MKIGVSLSLLTTLLLLDTAKSHKIRIGSRNEIQTLTEVSTFNENESNLGTTLNEVNRVKRSFGGLFDFDKVSSIGGGYSAYPSYPYRGGYGYTGGGIGNFLAPLYNKLAIGFNPYFNNRYRYYGGSPGYYSAFYSGRGFGFHR